MQRVEGEAVIQQKSGRIEVIAVEQVGQVGRIVVATTGGCCCTTIVMFEYSKDKWTARCLVSDWNRVATNLKVVWWRERIGTLLKFDTEKKLESYQLWIDESSTETGDMSKRLEFVPSGRDQQFKVAVAIEGDNIVFYCKNTEEVKGRLFEKDIEGSPQARSFCT